MNQGLNEAILAFLALFSLGLYLYLVVNKMLQVGACGADPDCPQVVFGRTLIFLVTSIGGPVAAQFAFTPPGGRPLRVPGSRTGWRQLTCPL